MKTLFKILGLVALLIIVFAIYVATRPSSYDVKRTKVIEAPSSVVFDIVNEYKTWEIWGPWKDVDPSIQPTYNEQTSGVGAGYSWASDQDGPGRMETLALTANESIDQKIYFDRRGSADVYWKFKPQENATEVTWGMKGNLGFMEKVFFTLMGGAENLFGKMFESGLENLALYAKDELDKHSIENKGLTDYGGGFYLHLTTECTFDEMPKKMDKMLPEVLLYAIGKNLPRAGAPFVLYHKYDEVNKRVEFSTCIPVAERVKVDGDIGLAYLEPGKYHKTRLTGAYKFLEEAWKKAFEFAKNDGYSVPENGKPFEVYSKGHSTTDNPAKWVTDIYLPVE